MTQVQQFIQNIHLSGSVTVVGQVLYILLLIAVSMRIILDTRDSAKALAYLLLIIFLPVAGIVIYFTFGVNYRKKRLYSRKLIEDEQLAQQVREWFESSSEETQKSHPHYTQGKEQLVKLLFNNESSPLTQGNRVQLLLNGDQKFPALLQALERAEHHIHLEYYIFEDDVIGNQLAEVLIRKAQAGVQVRFVFDDFGSRGLKKQLVKKLRAGGVEAYPFYEVKFIWLANRLNYRNHRKIIIIDGQEAFVGGMNVADRYTNQQPNNPLFWRDTHLQLQGPGVLYLQYLFLTSWFFASGQKRELRREFFYQEPFLLPGDALVQISAGGPDMRNASILLSTEAAISSAKKCLYISTPYFIPGDSILDSVKVAALGGVDVRLLVPGISDSWLVNAAARSYYNELLECKVRIFLYQKGFLHAKTLVIDETLSVVGTANMDIRSYELNFEVNGFVYDETLNQQLTAAFLQDLEDSVEIDPQEWLQRPRWRQLAEGTARMLSPLL